MSRTVLISGISSGIGSASGQLLRQHGFTVVGLSRREPDSAACDHWTMVDLANIDDLSSTVNTVVRDHPIDALINNAGSGHFGTLETFSSQQIQHALTVNLISHLVITRACLPTLRRHPRSDIVFVGSESALRGGRYGSVYSAAKFALRGAAQALRHECAAANCHVGIVQPGMVRSPFFDELTFEPGADDNHALLPADVAQAILGLLQSADHSVIDEVVVSPLQHVVKRKTPDP